MYSVQCVRGKSGVQGTSDECRMVMKMVNNKIKINLTDQDRNETIIFFVQREILLFG